MVMTLDQQQDLRNALVAQCFGHIDALRKVAIVKTYDTGGGFKMASCEICEAECGPDQMIVHVGDCPLTVLNHQT